MKLAPPRRSFTPRQRSEILARQAGLCYLCKQDLGDVWQIDHRVPIALDGAHAAGNWEAVCIPCHSKKTGVDRKAIAKVARIIKANDPLAKPKKRQIPSRPFPKVSRPLQSRPFGRRGFP